MLDYCLKKNYNNFFKSLSIALFLSILEAFLAYSTAFGNTPADL